MEEFKVSIYERKDRDGFYMQYRDPVTGRKVRQSTKTSKRREAERKAAKWEEELRAKGDVRRYGRLPWSEFRELYEVEALTALAETTDVKVCGVLNMLERFLSPRRLCDVTADALSRYQQYLRDNGRTESTIKSHLAHIRAALSWAVQQDLLPSLPKFPKVQRAKRSKVMKGRPITTEEFERMLAKIEAGLLAEAKRTGRPRAKRKRKFSPEAITKWRERQAKRAAAVRDTWEQLLRGLWLSGLRLGEALQLHWTDETKLCVDFSCHHPMLRIPAEMEKGHKDRLLPMSPEFAEFLLAIPEHKRTGYVFDVQGMKDGRSERLGVQQVSRTISKIGEAANVKVSESAGKVKVASAHDFRRAFGSRWADRIMPQRLMELMRHESIETTLKYYVGQNAQATAAVLWEAHRLNRSQAPESTSQHH